MNLLKKTGALLLSLAMLSSAAAFGAAAKSTDASSVVKARSVSLHSVRGKDGKLLNEQPVTVYQVATCHVDGTWEWLGGFADNPPVINVNTEEAPVYAKVVFKLSEQKKNVVNSSGSFKNVVSTAAYAKDDDPGTEIVVSFGNNSSDVYYEVLISDIAENKLPNNVMPATGVYQLSKALESRAAAELASLGTEVKATGTTAEIDAAADEEKSLSSINLPNYLEDRTDPTDLKDLSKIGYYLIVTNTNNDVEVQPTLEAFDLSGYQTSYIVPKSGAVSIGKEITSVSEGAVDTVTGSKQHHTSIAAADGTVSYKITVRTPKYSPDLFDDSLRNDGETDEAFFQRILNGLETANGTGKPFQPFTIIDDPADGLDIDISTLNVTIKDLGNTKESQVLIENGVNQVGDSLTLTPKTPGTDTNDGFVITFANKWLFANAPHYIYQDKPIEITFDATINDKAVYGSADDANTDVQTKKLIDAKTAPTTSRNYNIGTGNENTVQALYANDYSTGHGYAESHDTVVTYIAKVSLHKTAQDTGDDQQGVEFKLTCPANSVDKTVTTDASGNIDFGYLAPGTYTLSETGPLDGYIPAGDITFVVKAKESTANTAADPYTTYVITGDMIPTGVTFTGDGTGDVTIEVVDQTVLSLPGTGGAGTVMFVAGGAVFILMSGIVFVTYTRRKQRGN